jgi:hypothetical protein
MLYLLALAFIPAGPTTPLEQIRFWTGVRSAMKEPKGYLAQKLFAYTLSRVDQRIREWTMLAATGVIQVGEMP